MCSFFPIFTISPRTRHFQTKLNQMKTLLSCCFSLLTFSLFAQSPQPPATPAAERLAGFETRQALIEASPLANVPLTSVGPSVFGGRIVDLDVSPNDPSHFLAAYASGGLWKTTNNGTSFEPIFEQEAVMTIGDIAADWERNIIWIGTGENNSSRSSYAGVGMYRSEDGGATWEHKGLSESHHIGRIVLHPTDPNTVWVAVLGHLYSPNAERGVYKTTDGGASWSKTLFINENAGAIDLVIDPSDANILYAGIWERERRAWNFVEAGAGSGIHKSTDGGATWQKVSGGKSGFPSTTGTGRIGLDIAKDADGVRIYAILDNYDRRAAEYKKEEGLTKEQFRNMSKTDFLNIKEEDLGKFLKDNNFPKRYSAKKVTGMVRTDKITAMALVEYLEDANSLLFDTPVIGSEVYSSTDGGKTWQKTHEGFLDDLYYSYGYYFGQIRVNPSNADQFYIFGVPVLRSDDGGKTFVSVNGANVHVDHHACWVNPDRPGHVIIGNDGGVNISYDAGEHWVKCNTPAVGQFYYVAVDDSEPYNIYGGLQDNGVWKGASNYKASDRWHNTGHYPYDAISGGDGMQVAIDSRDNKTVYTGFQFGNYFRINQSTGEREYITPKHDLGERPLRWNWQTPIHLSVHNQDILYMGSNKLHRSMNQGDDFEAISEDLTTGGLKGDVAYSTLTAIHESDLQFGLLYTGSDDGLVHVSKNGGADWEKITNGLPARMWVTRIQASVHKKGRVYLSMNGYRWDDFSPYIFTSEDYGKSWRAIHDGLPFEPVNVIKEDAKNADVLYVGTDHGLYVSLDRGKSWSPMPGGMPAVAVHDVVIHPKTEDIILGTHGRSFWKGSAKEIRQLDQATMAKSIHLFALQDGKRSGRWGGAFSQWREPMIPEMQIPMWVKQSGPVKIEVKTDKGSPIKSYEVDAVAGLQYGTYDFSLEEKVAKKLNNELKEENDKVKEAKNGQWYLPRGDYKIVLTANGQTDEQKFTIK